MNLLKKLKYLEGRSKRTLANISYSVFLKLLSAIISLWYVPVLITFLGVEDYGVWLTLNSVFLWAGYFNLGLGNALKNKLAHSISINDNKASKEFVSTAYALVGIIFIAIMGIMLLLNSSINWVKILNITSVSPELMWRITNLLIVTFTLRFILQLIVQVLQADQKVALSNVVGPITQLISLSLFLLVSNFYNGGDRLLLATAVITIVPNFVFVMFSIIMYFKRYRGISPSIGSINFSKSKDLLDVGYKFLIIQLSIMVITQFPNIIISRMIGSEAVAVFGVSQKFFSLLYMGYAIVIKTTWPAFTEAYAKKDFKWMESALKRLKQMWFLLLIFAVMMLLGSKLFYRFWIGEEIHIPFKVSFFSFLYYIMICYGGIYTTFLAAISKLNKQVLFYVFGAISFVPLAWLFVGYYNVGVSGVILTMIMCSFYYMYAPFEVKNVLINMKNGIWK